MNNRIKKLRLMLEMNQSEFSSRIGIGQAALSAIEKGIRNITDRTIKDICREFSVDEIWLRTGNGDMFAPTTRSEKLARYFGEILVGEDERVKNVFSALSEMEPEFWNQVEKFINSITKNSKQNEIDSSKNKE